MDVQITRASITELDCDALIVNLFEGVTSPGGATGAVDKALDGLIGEVIQKEQFKGKLGSLLSIHTHGKIPARRVLVAGLGPKEEFSIDSIRTVMAAAARAARDSHASTVATILHGAGIGRLSPVRSAQATVEGAVIGTYRFLRFKSQPPETHQISSLIIAETDPVKAEAAQAGAKRGRTSGNAVNTARDLVNAPANQITPSYLAEFATSLAIKGSVDIQILERSDCARLGMGSYLAVTDGSTEPPKFIVARYHAGPDAKKTVAIVGKGVTFDSGGLSLKDASSMATMKDDMSGAAAVLAVVQALPELAPKVNVLAIVAATENMPSGSAMRPGDVLRAMNGKTIEVENTDAEGRLTLADALCYAVSQGADEMLDFATLTGACVVALGRDLSGVFCNNEQLFARLQEVSETSGDKIWRLPLHKPYFEQIKSEVADMKNTGGREAGATTAALLLEEFVDGRPWAHIDIAGPAFLSNGDTLFGKGGTGAGVRLLIEYLAGSPA